MNAKFAHRKRHGYDLRKASRVHHINSISNEHVAELIGEYRILGALLGEVRGYATDQLFRSPLRYCQPQ